MNKHNPSANSMLPPRSNFKKSGSFRSGPDNTQQLNDPEMLQKINSLRSSQESKPLVENSKQNITNNTPVEESKKPEIYQNISVRPPIEQQIPPQTTPSYPNQGNIKKTELLTQPNTQIFVKKNEKEDKSIPKSLSYYNISDSSMAQNQVQAQKPRFNGIQTYFNNLTYFIVQAYNRIKPPYNLPVVDRAPTIPEDENESAISSMQANPREMTTKSIGNPGIVRTKSQASVNLESPSMKNPNLTGSFNDENGKNSLRNIDFGKQLNKQKSSLSQVNRNIDENSINNLRSSDNEKPLDLSKDEKSVSHTQKTDGKMDIEEVPEEIPQEENGDEKEETPRVEENESTKENITYFQSRDPAPKTVAPVGGSGPTLTKTIVKPKIEKPVQESPQGSLDSVHNTIKTQNLTKISDKQEEDKLAAEAEELRKLEEEVDKLQKEAEEVKNPDLESPGETSVYSEQIVMVDGK